MYNRFHKIMGAVIEASDVSMVPNKYLALHSNFARADRVVREARKLGFRKGLDFGCGMSYCSVLAKIYNLKIVGLDIPEVGGKKRNNKGNRRAGPSPYLSVQKTLQRFGYPIVIADTTRFPWDFRDNEFEFVIAWFALNKQHMDREDWSMKDRLNELVRITKPKGVWFLHPKSHAKAFKRSECNTKRIKAVVV